MRSSEIIDNLLDRLQSAVIDAAERRDAIVDLERKVRALTANNEMLKKENAAVARFERFVESTPERLADWQSWSIANKPSGDDIAF